MKANSLKQTAQAIFNAGIQAVSPEACIVRYLTISGSLLQVAETEFDLDEIKQIFVVGAGKASAAMAHQVENILGHRITDGLIITK
ncbi:MAG: DUF4147 domain-containing protein, partial [Desulfobacteraceae bacterium]|nr:DUF4147 domain-containing protein [Desulfobacteraceae bacterium]